MLRTAAGYAMTWAVLLVLMPVLAAASAFGMATKGSITVDWNGVWGRFRDGNLFSSDNKEKGKRG